MSYLITAKAIDGAEREYEITGASDAEAIAAYARFMTAHENPLGYASVLTRAVGTEVEPASA